MKSTIKYKSNETHLNIVLNYIRVANSGTKSMENLERIDSFLIDLHKYLPKTFIP